MAVVVAAVAAGYRQGNRHLSLDSSPGNPPLVADLLVLADNLTVVADNLMVVAGIQLVAADSQRLAVGNLKAAAGIRAVAEDRPPVVEPDSRQTVGNHLGVVAADLDSQGIRLVAVVADCKLVFVVPELGQSFLQFRDKAVGPR